MNPVHWCPEEEEVSLRVWSRSNHIRHTAQAQHATPRRRKLLPCSTTEHELQGGTTAETVLPRRLFSLLLQRINQQCCARKVWCTEDRAQWRAPGANMAVAVLWLPREP